MITPFKHHFHKENNYARLPGSAGPEVPAEESLLDFIIQHGYLREYYARQLTQQLGGMLRTLHEKNTFHGDIKLEYIWVAKLPAGYIKILRLSNPAPPGAAGYSTSYFPAPELFDAASNASEHVDIWSIGVVLYTVVCGHVPFDGENIERIHNRIKKGDVGKIPSRVTSKCKHLLGRMLTVDPKERASLEEVLSHPWVKGQNLIDQKPGQRRFGFGNLNCLS